MAAPGRKLWLDWQRGLAVLFMVEWHTYDSWRADAVANGFSHTALAIVGGFAAPSFLYMAGLSQVLADGALERKGLGRRERCVHALRRAGWLLGVAYLYPLAKYLLFGGFRNPGAWHGILRVDVLHVIAASLLLSALLTALPRPALRTAAAALAALAVAFAAPVVAAWKHPELHLLDYLYCEAPRGIFFLFPWAVFSFAGGAFARMARAGAGPAKWIGAGAALFAFGWLCDKLPSPYGPHNFWITSPYWVAMRLGVVVAISGLLQLVPERADRWLAWLRMMGRHSLLGYFVSIELPYGFWSQPLHKQLGLGASLAAVVAMIAVTWGASMLSERYDLWKAGRARRAEARPAATPAP